MTKKILFFVFNALFVLDAFSQNQLKNSGFEEQTTAWNFWGGTISDTRHSGNKGMMVVNDQAKWSGADQLIFLPEGISKVEVTGWMKTENVVQGTNTWEMARIAIEFLDENGALTGGYPPVVGQAQGTTDWKEYRNVYFPSKQAKQIKVQAVMGNCTGKVYFDDISLLLFDADGKPLQGSKPSGPLSTGRWYEIKVDAKNSGSHYVDWSNLLDAPAGKHGFVKVKEGQFVFEDGTNVRFWGTNLVATDCFPDKAKADSVAQRLAKMGCNLVRLHHMDAPWSRPNIFGNAGNTRQLSEESLDQLDYLIAALKKKGIYVFLDLLVHRDFMSADGITNKPPDLGGKQVGYFDEKIIELQKEYIKQLLNHQNKYTSLMYKDEPAIVASEFINESTLFVHFGGDILNETYRKQLDQKFLAAGNSGKKLSVFDLDYSTYNSGVITPRAGIQGDVKASLKFLSETEQRYYQTMYEFMRSVGVKYPLAGSNFPIPVLANQRNNSKLDFTITNDYWDHPQLWKIGNDWSRVLYAPINNTSLIRNPAKSIVNNIAKYKWYGKPIIVTEYNACYPNEYILEAIPMVAAYARLQGMDGMLQFDFGSAALGEQRITPFSLSKMPDHLAQWVVAAPMFMRGDIQTASGLVTDVITEEQCLNLPSYSDFLDKNYFLSFVTKVAKTSESGKGENISKYMPYYNADEGVIKSETGELMLNEKKGILTIKSAKVQGVIGKLKDGVYDFPMMTVKLKNEWASVMVVSKDNKPLSETSVCYLVIVTPSKMKGQEYNDGRQALLEVGELPLMAQVAEGEVLIKTGKEIEIYSITTSGQKAEKLEVLSKYGAKYFDVSKGKSYVYEITLK